MNKHNKSVFIFILLAMLFSNTVHARPEVLGWLEWAYIEPGATKVKAKLDTGARTSSLHAINIVPFTVDDELWVRFSVPEGNRKQDAIGDVIQFEKPVVRETKIKEHIGDSVSRYVVEIGFCISGKNYAAAVTLADRSSFNYPLLLGRSLLKGNFIVDPDKIFIANKSCVELN